MAIARVASAMTISRFADRAAAGEVLAAALGKFAGDDTTIVLALPRGGLPVAYAVAHSLGAPLDVFIVRKLGVPNNPEYAMGAIARGGVRVLDEDIIRQLGITSAEVERIAGIEMEELERREQRYRGARPFPDLAGKTVILVDDGLATGSTMRAAVKAIRLERPAKIVVAVPVAAPQTCDALRAVADEVVCATRPEPFIAVGQWYQDFSQTTDEEVRDILEMSRRA